jgi:acyl dehydratase
MEARPIGADLVGTQLPPAEFTWDARDAIVYALGVGADPQTELDYVYEARGPAVLPTFALLPSWWAMKDLGRVVDSRGHAMVHAAQTLDLRRTVPASGRVRAQAAITAVWDKGSNSLVEVTCHGDDDDGPLFETRSATMILGIGGWGGERGPSSSTTEPDRPADCVRDGAIRPDQSALYRLSGDHNPLHIDPAAARAAGFDDVFLHGLCTLGFAARALLSVAPRDTRLTHIETRFASPLYLDRTLRTSMWDLGDGSWSFSSRDGERAILANGRAMFEAS